MKKLLLKKTAEPNRILKDPTNTKTKIEGRKIIKSKARSQNFQRSTNKLLICKRSKTTILKVI